VRILINKYDLYGETYYNITDVEEFIEQCNRQNKIIWCIEFFRIINGTIIPYDSLQSIDSSDLYNLEKEYMINVNMCNNFIKSCVNKYSEKLKDLYFSAIIDE